MWTGFGTVSATDARHFGRHRREHRRRSGDDAVGRLDDRRIQARYLKTHHRAAHQVAAGVGFRFDQREQFAERRAEQHFPVARLTDVAGERDDARNDRFAVRNGAPGGVGRGDVETLYAHFRRTFAGRNFLAGQNTDQLFSATGRVTRRHGGDFEFFAELGNGGFHGGDGFRLVVLDTDENALWLQQVAEDADAAHDILGALAHQHVIAGHERLAFGPVDDQVFHRHRFGGGQLGVAREHRAAKADDARIAQNLTHALGFEGGVIRNFTFDPLITAVRFDDDCERRQAGGVRRHAFFDGEHGAGGRCMHGRRNPRVGIADALALEYVLAHFDKRLRLATDALVQRHDQDRR